MTLIIDRLDINQSRETLIVGYLSLETHHSIMKKTILKPYIFILLSLLVITACTEKQEEIRPQISDLTESIYASVSIQPEDDYLVYTSTSGILEKVFIDEGDEIKKGQILAKVTTTNPVINRDNARLSVELAREKYYGTSNTLSSINNEIEQLEEQVRLDSLNYFRQKNLWNQSIGSRSELENKQLKFELTKKKIAGLKKKFKQTEVELENNYKKSQNALKKAQSDFNDYLIKAKMDGMVYSLLKNEGELISPQEPLAKIGKSDRFLIDMRIDEVDISKVIIGQQILITLDAYQGEVFEGKITKIFPQKDERTQTFKVEGQFDQAPKVLYAGLSGEANIIYAQKENVISIPMEYLIDNQKVKTVDGETIVKPGIKTMDRVEILSGIDTSTHILKP